jgi:hypothetical protein
MQGRLMGIAHTFLASAVSSVGIAGRDMGRLCQSLQKQQSVVTTLLFLNGCLVLVVPQGLEAVQHQLRLHRSAESACCITRVRSETTRGHRCHARCNTKSECHPLATADGSGQLWNGGLPYLKSSTLRQLQYCWLRVSAIACSPHPASAS